MIKEASLVLSLAAEVFAKNGTWPVLAKPVPFRTVRHIQ